MLRSEKVDTRECRKTISLQQLRTLIEASGLIQAEAALAELERDSLPVLIEEASAAQTKQVYSRTLRLVGMRQTKHAKCLAQSCAELISAIDGRQQETLHVCRIGRPSTGAVFVWLDSRHREVLGCLKTTGRGKLPASGLVVCHTENAD